MNGYANVFTEVPPLRVGLNDQLVLLFSPPFLDFFLAVYRCSDVRCFFEINQFVYIVFLREAFDSLGFVFIHTTHQIVGHADVHHFVVPVGEEVHEVAMFTGHKISPFGRNDMACPK